MKNKILKKLMKYNSKTHLLLTLGHCKYATWLKNQTELVIKINKMFADGDKQVFKLTTIRVKKYGLN